VVWYQFIGGIYMLVHNLMGDSWNIYLHIHAYIHTVYIHLHVYTHTCMTGVCLAQGVVCCVQQVMVVYCGNVEKDRVAISQL